MSPHPCHTAIDPDAHPIISIVAMGPSVAVVLIGIPTIWRESTVFPTDAGDPLENVCSPSWSGQCLGPPSVDEQTIGMNLV